MKILHANNAAGFTQRAQRSKEHSEAYIPLRPLPRRVRRAKYDDWFHAKKQGSKEHSENKNISLRPKGIAKTKIFRCVRCPAVSAARNSEVKNIYCRNNAI